MKKIMKRCAESTFKLFYQIMMLPAKRKKGRVLFDHHELELLHKALLSQTLFSQNGRMVPEFERKFAEHYGVPYAVASTSGTAAIHVALGALDLNPGDEVITAPITDLGTIIPILYQNAIPVFADVDDTYTMDPEDIERKITERTRAIIVVHLFGNTCDMEKIMDIGQRHHIPVIEDCAQAHKTEYRGRFVGTIGDIGCFSFQQSKHMTTGDGGMTITSNKTYSEKMKLFVDKNYARKGWGARAYYGLALNYRMNELTAAVGIAQLAKVHDVVEKRRMLGQYMSELLSSCPEFIVAPVTSGAAHSFWLYPLGLKTQPAESFAGELLSNGVKAMVGYTVKPIYLCTESLTHKKTYGTSGYPFTSRNDKFFDYKEGLCPKAESMLQHLLCIPLDESWTKDRVKVTAEKILKCAKTITGRHHAVVSQDLPGKTETELVQIYNESKVKKTRVAIVGCGYIGKWHALAYARNPNVEIAAFVDIDRARAEQLAGEYGPAKVYQTHLELLGHDRVDAVSLCTLPGSHHEISMDLLNAGVHVLCEKPLAVSVHEAEEMVAAAHENNLVLLTAFKFRFFEEVNKAKEMIAAKRFGRIINFRLMFAGYLDISGKWYSKKHLSGGGVIMDNGSHAFDLVRYILGDFNIVSTGINHHQYLDVEDTARILVRLQEGASGMIDLSWSAGVPSSSYLEVYGEEGSLFLDLKGISYKFKTWGAWKRVDNKTDEKDGFSRQINHFIDCVEGQMPLVIEPCDGIKTQVMIETAYQSFKTKESHDTSFEYVS
jgi:perosamine synthetase